MLAGLPKAPRRQQPDHQPEPRARSRQLYIIERMQENGFITAEQAEAAKKQELQLRDGADTDRAPRRVRGRDGAPADVSRSTATSTYTRGLKVYTTIEAADQDAAYQALRKGIMDYERRQIYRGPEKFVDLPTDPKEADDAIDDALADHPDNGDVMSAVVLEANAKKIMAVRLNGEQLRDHRRRPAARAVGPVRQGAAQDQDSPRRRDPRGQDAQEHLGDHPAARGRRRLRRAGSARRRHQGHGRRLRLRQEQVQPRDPGLAPAGLELQALHLLGGAGKGLHARAPSVNDAPLFFDAGVTGGQPWEPKNYDGKFDGPMSLRTRAGQVEEHGVDPRSCRPSARRTRRTGSPTSASMPRSTRAYLTDGAGRRLGHADADGDGLLGVRQRRLPHQSLADHQDHRPEGQGAGRKPAAAAQRDRCAPSTRATPSS